MNPLDIKRAFGPTPAHTKAAISRALHSDPQPQPRQSGRTTLALLLAAALVLSCAALAASRISGLSALFSLQSTRTGAVLVNEPVLSALYAVGQTYEGSAVRCTLDKALYDTAGQTLSLGWTMEPLSVPGENEKLYVICTEMRAGDDWFQPTSFYNCSEFFLKRSTSCAVSGMIPENAGTQISFTFAVLRTEATVIPFSYNEALSWSENRANLQSILDAGQLPVEGDGHITPPVWEDRPYNDVTLNTYLSDLLVTGLMTLVDHFTLTLDAADFSAQLSRRTLTEPVTVDFGSGPMTVTQCVVTPTRTHITLDAPHAVLNDQLCFVLLQTGEEIFLGGACWYTRPDAPVTLDISPTPLFPDTVILVPHITFGEHSQILFDPETAIYLPLVG